MSTYETLSWSNNEGLTADKLNRAAANDEHFNANIPTIVYLDDGDNSVSVKTVMIAGKYTIGRPNSGVVHGEVSFPNGTFSSGCEPHVTATIVATNDTFTNITIRSQSDTATLDNRGFRFTITNVGLAKFAGNLSVHWCAVGYKTAA